MGKIVFAWEFGGGLGHIQYNLSLAMKFKEGGHDVICIMKHVANAEKIMGQHGIKVLQAPVFWEVNVDAMPNTYNYALNLFNLGYTIGDGLISMAKAWRNLFDLFMPDLVVIDHAPTALIALRGTPIKTVLYGTGYFSPPKQSPMPSLMPWVKAPKGLMESSEKKVIKTINKALSQLQAPLLQKLSDLFTVDDDILITFKELDHYETREPTKYWGPVLDLPEGLTLSWPGRFNKKIFCYLKHDNPHSENLLYALQRIEAAVVIYAPGTSEKLMQEIQTPNITFVQEQVNMHNICKECDLVICHAGIGTVVTSLLYGKPLLVIPGYNHLEQVLTARNVIRLKAGLAILKRSQEVQAVNGYQEAVLRLLNEPHFQEQAASFAEKYKDFDPEQQINQIAERCEEIMNKRQ